MLPLKAETWIWWSICILVLICRFLSRFLLLRSVKNFQLDDWAMLATGCVFTVLIVMLNVVENVETNLMTVEELASLTAASIKRRTYGSKMVLIVEQSMIFTIWGCKACLLLMYSRMTMGLKQQLAVKIIAGYAAAGLLIMEIFYFAIWCRPFSEYWAVPASNLQCSTATHHLIMNAVFNISSDVLMMGIPLPILAKSKLQLQRKLVLCGVFSLGIFVILAASLSKYYSFSHPFSSQWAYWYAREASTALLVCNLPNCWTLLRHYFNVRSFMGSSYGKGASSRTRKTYVNNSTMFGSHVHTETGRGTSLWNLAKKGERSESKEDITRDDVQLQIWQQVQFGVDDHTDDESQQSTNNRAFPGASTDGLKTQCTASNKPVESQV